MNDSENKGNGSLRFESVRNCTYSQTVDLLLQLSQFVKSVLNALRMKSCDVGEALTWRILCGGWVGWYCVLRFFVAHEIELFFVLNSREHCR